MKKDDLSSKIDEIEREVRHDVIAFLTKLIKKPKTIAIQSILIRVEILPI